jgi:hypothetical protein
VLRQFVQEDAGGDSGTTTLSAIFSVSLKSLPCRPAAVSSTTWVMPLGGRASWSLSTSQLAMGLASGGRRCSHRREDCCRSASHSITEWPRLA